MFVKKSAKRIGNSDSMDPKNFLTMWTLFLSLLLVAMVALIEATAATAAAAATARPSSSSSSASASALLSILDSEGEREQEAQTTTLGGRKLFKLVNNKLVLPYHHGPLLTGGGSLRASGAASRLNVYLLWYGEFSPAQKSTIVDFLASFPQQKKKKSPWSSSSEVEEEEEEEDEEFPLLLLRPSVRSWWKVMAGYKDASGAAPFASVSLAGESTDAAYSLGKKLKTVDIEALLLQAFVGSRSSETKFPVDSNAIYFVLTAHDVFVQGFCMHACASHSSFPSPVPVVPVAANLMQVPYAWVGNAAVQCPGLCAWPFALPRFGGSSLLGATVANEVSPLVAPNGDVGMDGMVMNMASMLAGVATNPFRDGYYQGHAAAPLEAATACAGIYGRGAYPGFPGELLVHPISGASYNAHGVNGRQFLLPALWNSTTLACTPPS